MIPPVIKEVPLKGKAWSVEETCNIMAIAFRMDVTGTSSSDRRGVLWNIGGFPLPGVALTEENSPPESFSEFMKIVQDHRLMEPGTCSVYEELFIFAYATHILRRILPTHSFDIGEPEDSGALPVVIKNRDKSIAAYFYLTHFGRKD